jgi:hypothetical protein
LWCEAEVFVVRKMCFYRMQKIDGKVDADVVVVVVGTLS